MYRSGQWHPTPVLLPGESHGRWSLVGCGPWGRWESDTTEQLHFHFSLSCIGEGNGNPLQCSCLENLRDGGAWWAAVSGVTQSDTTEVTQQQQQQDSIYVPTPCWLKHLCSIRALVPVSVFLSLYLCISGWFPGTRSWLHNPGNISLSPSSTFSSLTLGHQVPVH